MLDCPDLSVPMEVMQHVVHVESSRNPYAIGVVGGYLARQPRTLDEALAAVRQLKEEGYNFSVGIAQVNRYNLTKYGINTYAEAFEACPNLRAGSRILRECYDRAQDWGKAFSCYYSGNFSTGFEHGYVQKIFASMKQVQYRAAGEPEPIRVIPYSGNPRKRAADDSVPLQSGAASAVATGSAPVVREAVAAAPYPEPPAVRRYLPATPLSVTAAALAATQKTPSRTSEVASRAETAEDRPAIPVPGPGAVMPPAGKTTSASSVLSQIPTQVVGVNGDPYRTRVLPPPTAGLPANQLPLPDPNAMSGAATGGNRNATNNRANQAMVARKGGNLVHNTESSGEPENTAKPAPSGEGTTNLQGVVKPADKSFVF